MGELPTSVDVLIIGAGFSGISAGRYLKTGRPGDSFLMLEAQETLGGTWATHRFPGIRSDSDLYTFGFGWKPWGGDAIASGSEILDYLTEAVDETGLRDHICLGCHASAADWDSATQRWTVTVNTPDGAVQITCRFLWSCAGYYRHDGGYTPDLPGLADFTGPVIHPQTWPDDLDLTGKRVVVIGSGATAATLVPALVGQAGAVTVLQRSPTYYYARPSHDPFAEQLRALDLPPDWLHEILRRKSLLESEQLAARARSEPEALAAELIAGVRAYLGPEFDIETHFTPHYPPWRQRLALLPEGDFLRALRDGKAQIETGEIAQITGAGVTLTLGQHLAADVIVTATGLELTLLGDMALRVDGQAFDPAQAVTHQGVMLSGLPNLALVFGYLRSSWTLRTDLVSGYVLRLLAHMEARGAGSVTPVAPADMPLRPWIEPANFNPGYILRALDRLPRQGVDAPWVMTQDYFRDRKDLPAADLDDGSLVYR